MYFICTICSIREYQFDFSPLYWHNIPAYYALNYAGIFDRGLPICLLCKDNHPRISCSSRRPLATWLVTVLLIMTTFSWVWPDHYITIAQLRADTVITSEVSSSCHSMTASCWATQSTCPHISYNLTTASFEVGAKFHHCTLTTSFTTVYHSTWICFSPTYQ